MSNEPDVAEANDDFDVLVEDLTESYRKDLLSGSFIKVVGELEHFDDFASNLEIDPYLLMNLVNGDVGGIDYAINVALDRHCASLAAKQIKYDESH